MRKLAIVALVALSAALALLPGRPAGASDRPPTAEAALVLPTAAFAAAPRTLDSAFGAGGKVLTDFGHFDAVEDLAVQSDGKLVAVGQMQDGYLTRFALARYERNGSLDPSFGAGGKVTTDFGRAENRAFAVALQADGKIVAAGLTSGGQTGADIALARYNADGALDTSFGVGGRVVTDFDLTHDSASGLVIQPDGRLVVVGRTRRFGPVQANPPDFVVARYFADGRLDASFGGDGKASIGFTADWYEWGLPEIALAPDGKIVVAGYSFNSYVSPGPFVIDVARLNGDGSLDASFDGDGKVVTASSLGSTADDVVVQPDGKIVVAGVHEQRFALLRYAAGGALDSTFGAGGVASAEFGSGPAGAQALARQRDGKLVAAGAVAIKGEYGDYAFAAARFDSSGKTDRSFHGGTVTTDFGATTWDEARGLALQADGKIVVGGFSAALQDATPTSADFALIRYLAPLPFCRVPNVRGKTFATARSAIARAYCGLGRVKRKASKKVRRGRVISQSPRATTTLPNRGKVNLVVSRGRR